MSIAAHSLGAILTVRGLTERPDIEEYIHSLTLAAPAGFGGVQFLRGAVESILFELSHRPSTEEIRHTVRDALRYSIAANIRLRDRINEARHTTIIPETRELLEKGLPIMALAYPNDRLIHHDPLVEGLTQAGVPVIKTVQPPTYLGHNAHLYYPETVVTNQAANSTAAFKIQNATDGSLLRWIRQIQGCTLERWPETLLVRC